MGYLIEYTDEFESWWKTLSTEQQEDVDAIVEVLERLGPALPRPYADHVKSSRIQKLKELRVSSGGREIRVLFVFDPRRTAIFLVGGDKTGSWEKWYEWAVPEAERIYEAYLEEIRKDGLI